jgi:hypothetical protein
MTLQEAPLVQAVSDGILYRMWAIGFFFYVLWLFICMQFVYFATTFQVITFQDWTPSVPLGFVGCQQVADTFL